jgi:hypothetical protein
MQEYTVSIPPPITNHQLYRGDTWSRTINIKEGGVLTDISADAFSLRITDIRGAVLHTLSIGSGIERTGTGQITITLSAAQTALLPVNQDLPYDLEWTRSTGAVKTLTRGKMICIPDTTP